MFALQMRGRGIPGRPAAGPPTHLLVPTYQRYSLPLSFPNRIRLPPSFSLSLCHGLAAFFLRGSTSMDHPQSLLHFGLKEGLDLEAPPVGLLDPFKWNMKVVPIWPGLPAYFLLRSSSQLNRLRRPSIAFRDVCF